MKTHTVEYRGKGLDGAVIPLGDVKIPEGSIVSMVVVNLDDNVGVPTERDPSMSTHGDCFKVALHPRVNCWIDHCTRARSGDEDALFVFIDNTDYQDVLDHPDRCIPCPDLLITLTYEDILR